MKVSNLALVLVSLVLSMALPYLLISGSPEGEAVGSYPKAMVSVIAFNSSSDVLYDFAALMNLAALETLADANPGSPIPEQDLLGALPGPLPGWNYLIWGSTSQSNATYSTALGMYSRGMMLAIEEIAYIAIASQVGGFSTEFDPTSIEGIIGVDQGYPKNVDVQGYPGVEWRSSGANLGEITQFQGNLESIGALWVGLGSTIPVPEFGFLLVSVPTLLVLRRIVTR
ncbi:MAG: hypothetical protein HXS50_05065 [Theionarchaea archaeon]|nr:hypothetical protein [Theionarchaea archaeon]